MQQAVGSRAVNKGELQEFLFGDVGRKAKQVVQQQRYQCATIWLYAAAGAPKGPRKPLGDRAIG